MSAKTGGAAFPNAHYNGKGGYDTSGGMTLRDYFAAQSLGVIAEHFAPSGNSSAKDWAEWVAQNAYSVADAMIAAGEAK